MMQVHLSRQAAPADWGLGNLLSHTGHGWQIHLPDDSALMALQQAARRIANLGIRDVQLAGSWRKEQQWAFAQGFMPTAGEASEGTLRWAEGPDAELLALEHRLYCARWVRRLTNLPAQDLGPLELALESVGFLAEDGYIHLRQIAAKESQETIESIAACARPISAGGGI